MNTRIKFETAKLLNEKGYPQLDAALTIAEVVMWLYEKHGVWIMVKRVDYKTLVRWGIYVNNNYVQQNLMGYDSPTEAYEAAILYTLNILI